MIRITVIEAWPGKFEEIHLSLPEGSSAGNARQASGLGTTAVGMSVFGVRVEDSTALNDGDRLELLRGLTIDPKDARRKRADLRAVKHKKW